MTTSGGKSTCVCIPGGDQIKESHHLEKKMHTKEPQSMYITWHCCFLVGGGVCLIFMLGESMVVNDSGLGDEGICAWHRGQVRVFYHCGYGSSMVLWCVSLLVHNVWYMGPLAFWELGFFMWMLFRIVIISFPFLSEKNVSSLKEKGILQNPSLLSIYQRTYWILLISCILYRGALQWGNAKHHLLLYAETFPLVESFSCYYLWCLFKFCSGKIKKIGGERRCQGTSRRLYFWCDHGNMIEWFCILPQVRGYFELINEIRPFLISKRLWICNVLFKKHGSYLIFFKGWITFLSVTPPPPPSKKKEKKDKTEKPYQPLFLAF